MELPPASLFIAACRPIVARHVLVPALPEPSRNSKMRRKPAPLEARLPQRSLIAVLLLLACAVNAVHGHAHSASVVRSLKQEAAGAAAQPVQQQQPPAQVPAANPSEQAPAPSPVPAPSPPAEVLQAVAYSKPVADTAASAVQAIQTANPAVQDPVRTDVSNALNGAANSILTIRANTPNPADLPGNAVKGLKEASVTIVASANGKQYLQGVANELSTMADKISQAGNSISTETVEQSLLQVGGALGAAGSAVAVQSSSNIGAIVGGIIGGLVGALLIGGVVTFFVIRSKRRRQAHEQYLPTHGLKLEGASHANGSLPMADVRPRTNGAGARLLAAPQSQTAAPGAYTIGFSEVEVQAALTNLASNADAFARALPAAQRAGLLAAALRDAPQVLSISSQSDLALQNYVITHYLLSFINSNIWECAHTANGWLQAMHGSTQVATADNRAQLRTQHQALLQQLKHGQGAQAATLQRLAAEYAAAFLRTAGMDAFLGGSLQQQVSEMMRLAMLCQLTALSADPCFSMAVSGWSLGTGTLPTLDSSKHHPIWRVTGKARLNSREEVLLCCKPGIIYSPSARSTEGSAVVAVQDVVTFSA